jgi:hypothetical protein
MWEEFNNMMKSGRIQRVVRVAIEKDTKSNKKSNKQKK